MTPEQKQIAFAELDGFSYSEMSETYSQIEFGVRVWYESLPDYTTYNALIPLIQKQSKEVKDKIGELVWKVGSKSRAWHCYYDATTEQLGDALLKATGKLKE